MRQPVRFGKYLLLDRIAVGGMAEVFAAKAFGAEGFERILAIKKILPTLGEDPEFVSMFVDEARIAVQLSHANIVQVLELGKHDEVLYIAMEYVAGRDLRQLIDRYRRNGQPMPVPQACAIAGRVCEALDYAHRKTDASGNPLGIVHRDVSPQNVLVSFDGDVKLIDFGIAKAERRVQKTQSGILKGKFSYMSPEQVRGDPVDRRSDVFAAGVLLWELICGRKLFTGESDYAVLEKVRKGEVPHPASVNPQVPQALAEATLAALAPEPRDRFQWCSELHDALSPFAQVNGAPFGSRRLSEWMREEFRSEHEKEQARMRRWLSVAEERTSPDARPPRIIAAGAGVAVAQDLRRTDEWHVAPDADTLVRPPTPTGRTRPGNEAEPVMDGTPQPTRLLRPGQGSAAGFDQSEGSTAPRRSERRSALTRAGKPHAGQPAKRKLFFFGALGAVGVAAAVYFAFGRTPGAAKLILTVQPAVPAELFVDGKSSGPLPPFVRLLPPGRHRIEVRAEGFKSFASAVDLRKQPAEVLASLQRNEPAATEPAPSIAPEPRTTQVATVDKPAAVRPPPRRAAARQVERQEADGTPERRDDTAAASPQPAPAAQAAVAPDPEPVEAAAREARLHIRSEPIGAEIRLAGRRLGRAPLTTEPLEPDREYEVTATLEGYVTVRRAVRTRDGLADVTLALPIQPVAGAASDAARRDLAAQPASAVLGYLVTSTRPVARVTIDGRETGRWTPVPEANPIALPAGAHTIVFETADGKRHEEALQIEPGKTARLVRDLVR